MFRADRRSVLSYGPCPTTILPLPTRTQMMLPCIRPCFLNFHIGHQRNLPITKDRRGRVGPGRTDRHTPVSATGRPPSVCWPRPTHDVTARGVKRAAGIGAERRGSTIFQRGDHERFEEETGSFLEANALLSRSFLASLIFC